MQDFWQVVVLAVVQGVAEFLPISSDGHLALTRALLGKLFSGGIASRSGLELDVMLHLGTLGSIVVVYWTELWKLLVNRPRLWRVLLATIPAVLCGLLLKDQIEAVFLLPIWAAVGLIVTGVMLLLIGRGFGSDLTEDQLSWSQTVYIGCFQALALLPGVSRSGSTICAGQSCGLSRLAAARFSFLMAVPVISGAVALKLSDLIRKPPSTSDGLLMALGAAISFCVGLIALRWLLSIVGRGSLAYFGYYCLIVGGVAAYLTWPA